MNKLIQFGVVALVALSLFSCSESKPNKEETDKKKEVGKEVSGDEINHGTKNFAVVWIWRTEKQFLIDSTKREQTTQLLDLWKKGVVQDVYFDEKGQFDKLNNNPNVSFFYKS